MKKYYLIVSVMVGIGVFALSAQAKDFGIRDAVKQQVRQIQDQIKSTRTEAKLNAQVADDNDEDFSQKRAELEKRKSEFEDRITAEREELRNRIEAKREELKTKLANVKNEAKKQAVEKIDKSMDALNDRMVEHFTKVLNQIEEVLKRIGDRADKTQERGLDVSTVRTAISEAVAAIKSARTAIEVQAAKTYSISVTNETTLKNKVGQARQLLHDDLSIVKAAVKAAHEAARKVAVALAQIVKPSPDSTSSPSPSPSPSVSPTPTSTPTSSPSPSPSSSPTPTQ